MLFTKIIHAKRIVRNILIEFFTFSLDFLFFLTLKVDFWENFGDR